MTDWLRDSIDQSWTHPERQMAEDVADLLDELAPAALDPSRSSVTRDEVGLHIALFHRERGPIVEIDDVGEILVSYGDADDRWAWEYVEQSWLPWEESNPLDGMMRFVRYLLTGRIQLEVRRRPWGVSARSFIVDRAGNRQLFIRGGTVRPYFRWQNEPDRMTFDFTNSA